MGLLQEANELVIANMNDRAAKKIESIANDIKRIAQMGYNECEVYYWNSEKLSSIDKQIVIDHFRSEGFDITKKANRDGEHLIIKWLQNGPKQCQQCGKYHEEKC